MHCTAGLTLLADNLVPFADKDVWFVLFVLTFPMVLANQAFPIMLRLIVSLLPRWDREHPEVYEYLLKHPRRCSTHLFPARETRLLGLVLLAFLLCEFGLFMLLDRNAEEIQNRPWGMRIMIGFFQAVSTRTTGFNCVNLAKLSAAMNVVYMVRIALVILDDPVVVSLTRCCC